MFSYGAQRNRSMREARGNGWHKKGYRSMGCMWINVRHGSYGCTRGQDVNESLTINEFWNQVIQSVEMEDGFPIPENWYFNLFSNKKALPQSDDEPISQLFDGGETVYVKVFDEDDNERVYDFGTGAWEYHVPGQHYYASFVPVD